MGRKTIEEKLHENFSTVRARDYYLVPKGLRVASAYKDLPDILHKINQKLREENFSTLIFKPVRGINPFGKILEYLIGQVMDEIKFEYDEEETTVKLIYRILYKEGRDGTGILDYDPTEISFSTPYALMSYEFCPDNKEVMEFQIAEFSATIHRWNSFWTEKKAKRYVQKLTLFTNHIRQLVEDEIEELFKHTYFKRLHIDKGGA